MFGGSSTAIDKRTLTTCYRGTSKAEVTLTKDRMDLGAVRELIKPTVAEAMLEFDEGSRLSLEGEVYEVEFDGTAFLVLAIQKAEMTEPRSTQSHKLRVNIENR